MLRITIELVPFGIEEKRKILGMIGITNDGSGSLDVGNYDATLSDEGPFTIDGKPGIWKKVRVKGFRRRELGPYQLLLAVLKKAIHQDKKKSARRTRLRKKEP